MDRQPTEVYPDHGQLNVSTAGAPGQGTEFPNRPVGFGWGRAAWTFLGTLLVVNFVLVLGIRIGRSDALNYFCPYYTLVADSARQGELVLWSPLVNGGCPVGFEPQVGAASPLELVLGLITGGNEPGFRLYWLLIWCLGGLGILVLARHLAAPPWMGCVGAIGYAFSAIYTCHAQHTSYLVAMSLFPWALWRLDVAIARRSLFAAVQAGALWGLSALGGYPGLILAGAGYAVAWSLGRVLLADQSRPTPSPSGSKASGFVRKLALLGVVLSTYFVAGLVVLSPTYVGFWVESRGYTSRAVGVSREIALYSWPVPPAALTTFASPYLSVWTAKSPHPAWTVDASMVSVYLSPLLLVLALTVRTPGSNGRFHWFLRIVALLYLLLALGGATPLYGWLYDLVPPVRFLRYAALFRCHYILTVVVLALLAVANAEKALEKDLARAFWKNAAIVSLATGAIAFLVFAAVVWRSTGNRAETRHLLLAIVHLVCVWSAVTLLSVWEYRRGRATGKRVAYRCFVVLAIVDAALTMALSNWTVYATRRPWRVLAASHVPALDLTARGLDRRLSTDVEGLPFNGNLLSKTPALTSYGGMVNNFHTEYVGHPILSVSALGSQRIWFSPRGVWAPLTADCFQQFKAAAERRGRPCLVLSDRNERSRLPDETVAPALRAQTAAEIAALPPVEPLSVTLVEYSPNRLVFEAVAPRDGWCLVTDRWASGWCATVNGEDVDVSIGNFIFRAVPVRQGLNHVAFRYHPFGHPWLLMLSWTTLASVLTATVVGRIAGKTEKPTGCNPWA